MWSGATMNLSTRDTQRIDPNKYTEAKVNTGGIQSPEHNMYVPRPEASCTPILPRYMSNLFFLLSQFELGFYYL